MPDKQIYEYALIRLVPKVERGEFMNIGVILFSKQLKFLDMLYHLDEKRIKAFSIDVDLQEIQQYLKAWKMVCEADPAAGEIAKLDQAGRFRWLTSPRSTIIQSSAVHPGLCDNPATLLTQLLDNYVL